jgi:hypothetical protein
VLFSTLLHLPHIRFHCVEGCWDGNQTVATFALAVSGSNHSAKSRPPFFINIIAIILQQMSLFVYFRDASGNEEEHTPSQNSGIMLMIFKCTRGAFISNNFKQH